MSADRNQNQNCLSPEQETDWIDTGISLQQGSISGLVKSKPSDWASPPSELPCGHSGFCNATMFPAVPWMQHLPGMQDVGDFFDLSAPETTRELRQCQGFGPQEDKNPHAQAFLPQASFRSAKTCPCFYGWVKQQPLCALSFLAHSSVTPALSSWPLVSKLVRPGAEKELPSIGAGAVKLGHSEKINSLWTRARPMVKAEAWRLVSVRGEGFKSN